MHQISPIPYDLPHSPQTLRELIEVMVQDCVQVYNENRQSPPSPSIRSAEEIEDMGQVGKIGFAIPYGSQEADVDTAIHTAITGFEDGLYRLFINEAEQTDLDAPLNLKEGDSITILRLVMLTGGFF